MKKYFGDRTDIVSEAEKEHAEVSRRTAGECIVLLENDGVLPITEAVPIALYGNGARRTVTGGTGSGSVNTRTNITVEQGLLSAGFEVTTAEWLDREDELCAADKKKFMENAAKVAAEKGKPLFIEIFDHPYKDPAPTLITEEDVQKSGTDTAIYVLSRISGEGGDRTCTPGDYLLYPEEKANLEFLGSHYAKTIVVLNVGGVMDLTEMKAIPGINAIVLMGQLGSAGGEALADVLTGEVTPSGKTVDTWAMSYEDYPTSREFSFRGSIHDASYEEGIFVGYRYFDSFDVKPLYPFGFGRSYTDFEVTCDWFEVEGENVTLAVNVQNIGSTYAGRETVQIYVSAPEGNLPKPYQQLVGFDKTTELAPGEGESMILTVPVRSFASYSEKEAAWILERGDYVLRVGTSSADTKIAGVITLAQDVRTETAKNLFEPDIDLAEIIPDTAKLAEKKAEGITRRTEHQKIMASEIENHVMEYAGTRKAYENHRDEMLTVQDVRDGNCTVEELTAQLSLEELAELCVGTARMGAQIVGNASCCAPGAAGDSMGIAERGIVGMVMADGPAGIRLQAHFKTDLDGNLIPGGGGIGDDIAPFETDLPDDQLVDYYQYCTAIPIGWSLAQSWNRDAVREAADMVGSEMEHFGIDLWLAPGMNIHRDPLCGRNFEYYSEDPLVTGLMAAAITEGVQTHPGKGVTIKHYAVNSQEENRYFVNSHVSERALREIYLKGFEIAVKESQPYALMTSYNLLNGIHTANSYDLIQCMLRDEWGFGGVVMTDWLTSQNVPAFTGKYPPQYPISASTGCVYAGNDIQMPGCEKNVQDIVDAVTSGEELDGYRITLGDVQFCAANVIRAAIRCEAKKDQF